MAFPVNGILDNFDRGDTGPPPSASWTTLLNGHKVATQVCIGNTTDDDNVSAWNTTYNPGCEMYFTILGTDSANVACYILNDYTNGYGYQVYLTTGNTIHIVRVDEFVEYQLGDTISQNFYDGDSIGASYNNGVIKAYYKAGAGAWSEIGSRDDDTYDGPWYLVLETWSNDTVDNFGGGALTGGAFTIDVSQSITVSESRTVTLPNALSINRSQSISVSESRTVSLNALSINVSQDITVSESPRVYIQQGIIVNIDHEEGDFSDYNTYSNDGGHLTVVAGAALAGTNYGLSCLIADINAMWGRKNVAHAPIARIRFYINHNNLSMVNGSSITVFSWRKSGGDNATVLKVSLVYDDGNKHRLEIDSYNDNSESVGTEWVTIANGAHYVEILQMCATGDGETDGSRQWWVDGTVHGTVTDINNYNITQFFAWSFFLGALTQSGTISGEYFLDELIVNDTGNEIGPILVINVSQDISIAESINDIILSSVDVSDSTSLTEDADVTINTSVAILESLGLTESIGLTTGPPQVDTSDEVTSSEYIEVLVETSQIDVSDSIIVTEDITVQVTLLPLNITVSDSEFYHIHSVKIIG